MRRIILGSALAICALLPAFSQTTCPATVFTPNLNLSLPALGTKNWNLCLNPNFQIIDASIARLQSPFLGPWSASTVYTKGAFVSFNNAIYISSIFSNFNNTPAVGSTAWQLFFTTDGGGSITAPASGWPAWLVPTISNSVLSVAASPIPNDALAHSSININGVDMSLGGTYTIGGAGGGCGPLSTDASSTDCGTGNSVGATYTGPPSLVQTYGDNLNGGASGQDGVVIGHDSGTNATLDQTVVIGDFDYQTNDPTAGMGGNESVFIGSANASYFGGPGSGVGANFSDSLGIGARNYQQFNGSAHPSYSTVVALGFQNVANENVNVVPGNFRDVVGIGDSAAASTHSLTDVVAIGDSALAGGNSAPGPSYSDVVAIGDVAASLPPNGSSTLIAIGLCPMCIGDVNNVTGALSESIAIGDEAMDSAVNTNDLIAIGDEAMFGPESGPCLSATPAFGGGSGYTNGDVITVVSSGASGCQFSVTTSGGAVASLTLVSGGDGYPTSRNNLSTTGGTGSGLFVNIKSNAYTTGNDDIAIGNFAGAAFRKGSENIALGTNACAVNYGSGGTHNGNSTTDGSENICIGDSAGQSVPTVLNDIIVIGDHAQASTSNSVVIGTKTTAFDSHFFGTIHTDAQTSPTASSGTLVGTNNGGAISGLSAATSVTVTFAGGAGFQVWNSCTANASAASTPVAVSAISLTSVMFSFPSLTGSLYFHCDGN
jgi:hypothetical protein